jgi:hypothetical protein
MSSIEKVSEQLNHFLSALQYTVLQSHEQIKSIRAQSDLMTLELNRLSVAVQRSNSEASQSNPSKIPRPLVAVAP